MSFSNGLGEMGLCELGLGEIRLGEMGGHLQYRSLSGLIFACHKLPESARISGIMF